MMRIGLDGRFWRSSAGGIGRYTRELVKNLLAIDSENQYILFITPDDVAECTLEAKNLEKVVTSIKHFSFGEQIQLTRLIESHQIDLMHFLNFNHPLNYRRPFITTIHDLTMNFFPVGRQRLPIIRQAYLVNMEHAARASVKVIVPAQVVKEDVVKLLKVGADKIEVIYEGATVPGSPNTQPNKEYLKKIGISKPYILFVSQWRPHKGLLVLLEAFAKIKESNDIQLVITGKPNLAFPEIPAAIERSVFRSDIITPGFIDDQLLDTLYSGAELFIFPSWYEGFGLPPLEAMARGVPVAASNTSVMPEVLGDAAAYFDPRDPSAMAKLIGETLANPAQLKALKTKGLKQAAKYSWKKMAEQTLQLYQSVMK